MNRYIYIVIFLYLIPILSFGQTSVAKVVTLDEFVVSAALEDFSIDEFIDQVKSDTTFYQAFLNLKYFPHDILGAITVYNKDDSEKGFMSRKAKQFLSDKNKVWMEITYEKTNGKIKRKMANGSILLLKCSIMCFLKHKCILLTVK